ncbi:MAG: hypothetical protein AB7L09_00270 [Nitrospira sp.]
MAKYRTVDEGGKIVEVEVPPTIMTWDDMAGFASLTNGNLSASVLPQFKAKTFSGRTGAGAISVPGLVAGDKVIAVWCVSELLGGGDVMSDFETTVSVNGQIQQLNTGIWSLKTFAGLFA